MSKKAVSTSLLIVLLVALVAGVGSGCGSFKDRIRVQILPEEELYNLGMEKFSEEKWDDAIAVFERFERLYVNSSKIQEVRLTRADAYFNKGRRSSFILAKAEYQSFNQLYPRYEDAAYIWKRIAECSFKQILPPNRDQSQTEATISDFQTFLQKFPDSEYVPEVRQLLNEAYAALAEYHRIVGMHYYKRKLYDAAAVRLKRALEQNVTLKDPESVLYFLAYSLARASDSYGKAYNFFIKTEQEQLSTRYRQLHEQYLYEAKQYLAELKERFPNATGRHSEVERAINMVSPLQQQEGEADSDK